MSICVMMKMSRCLSRAFRTEESQFYLSLQQKQETKTECSTEWRVDWRWASALLKLKFSKQLHESTKKHQALLSAFHGYKGEGFATLLYVLACIRFMESPVEVSSVQNRLHCFIANRIVVTLVLYLGIIQYSTTTITQALAIVRENEGKNLSSIWYLSKYWYNWNIFHWNDLVISYLSYSVKSLSVRTLSFRCWRSWWGIADRKRKRCIQTKQVNQSIMNEEHVD